MFNKTTLQDPHLKKLLDMMSKGDKKVRDELVAKINGEMKRIDFLKTVSPILYEVAYDNAAESEVFHELQNSDIDVQGPKFDVVTFYSLVRKIRVGRKNFFPLKSFADYRTVPNPRFVLIPDPKDPGTSKEFEDVDTAAATANGTFIFNVNFAQKLLDFAHVKGIKGKGDKYKSNGGPIPDEYEYIEFVIMHELMHYTYSDFHYHELLKVPMTIINYVGDFRTNHNLVKHGMNQLPMGLFSSYVNFHKQHTYQEMVDIVTRELDKLNKAQRDLVEGLFKKLGDNHEHQSKGKPKEIYRKPGDIDEHHKRTESSLTPTDGPKSKGEDKSSEDGKSGSPGKGAGTPRTIDYSQITPKFKWEHLLARMVGKLDGEQESTYRKISRRAVTGAMDVLRTGRGAVKPGEIMSPKGKKVKLAVVVDSSGSMHESIKSVMANLERLLLAKVGGGRVTDEFYFIPFSDSHSIYKCTMGSSGSYEKVSDVLTDKGASVGAAKAGKVTELLSNHQSGGTVFYGSISSDLEKLLSRGYNVLICSDSDLLWDSNWETFVRLYKSFSKQMFVMFDSRETFQSAAQKLKEASQNLTHL